MHHLEQCKYVHCMSFYTGGIICEVTVRAHTCVGKRIRMGLCKMKMHSCLGSEVVGIYLEKKKIGKKWKEFKITKEKIKLKKRT